MTAASLAFAASPVNNTQGKTGETPRVTHERSRPKTTQGKASDAPSAILERSPSNTYPGLQPDFTGKRDDGDIKKDVKRAVESQKDVSVDVDAGVVTLSGQVVTENDRERAITAARQIKGVRTVQDQMQVAGAGSQTMGEYFDDAGITAAVKSKLLGEKGLSSFKISVDTIEGVVTLTGDVKTQAQVDNAVAVVRQVEGVKRVDNKLLIKP